MRMLTLENNPEKEIAEWSFFILQSLLYKDRSGLLMLWGILV